MDVWGMTVAAFRRWYVLIPLLLVSLTVAYLVGARSQSDYEVSGAVMLLAPAENPYPSNPYADDSAVQILGIKAMSSSTRSTFADQGLSSEYEIDYDNDTPVMTMTVTAGSQEKALATGEQLVSYLAATLNRSQQDLGIARGARVTMITIDAPDVVNPTEGGTVRTTAVLAGLGVVGSFVTAVIVDAMFARRRSRRAAQVQSSAQENDAGAQAAGTTSTESAESRS